MNVQPRRAEVRRLHHRHGTRRGTRGREDRDQGHARGSLKDGRFAYWILSKARFEKKATIASVRFRSRGKEAHIGRYAIMRIW